MSKDTRQTVSRAIENVAASSEYEPLDLSTVQIPRPGNDPEWVIRGGTKLAMVNAGATRLLTSASSSIAADIVRPRFLAMHQVKDMPNLLIATPVRQAGENTVPVTWSRDSTRCRVNLQMLFLVRSINIGRRANAHIPVSLENVESLGPSLLLDLGRVYTTPVLSRKRPTTLPAERTME